MRNLSLFQLGTERGKKVLVVLHFLTFLHIFQYSSRGGGLSPRLFLLLFRVCEMEGSPEWKTEAEHCFPTIVQTQPARLTLWSRL